jgi:hypothetical protein
MQIKQHNKSFKFAHSLTLVLGTRAKALAPQLKRYVSKRRTYQKRPLLPFRRHEREVQPMCRKLGVVFVCAVILAVISSASASAEAPSAATQRQEQEKAAEKKLTELDKKMHELSAEFKKAEGKTQAETNRLYEEFKTKQGNAGKELEQLRKSSNETWDKAKVRMDKALKDLNGLYEKTKTRVREKDKDEAK